jgi:hypothetical protein
VAKNGGVVDSANR